MTNAFHAADVPRSHQAHSRAQAMVVLVGDRHVDPARSRGLPAVAIPEARADPQWSRRLTGQFVTVLMDAHPADRATAQRLAADLDNSAAMAVVANVAPHRHDGYGLSEWLDDHPRVSDAALLHLVAPSSAALTGLVAAA